MIEAIKKALRWYQHRKAVRMEIRKLVKLAALNGHVWHVKR